MFVIKMLTGFAILVVVIFASVATAVYLFQDRLVFVPKADIVTTPKQAGFSFEDVFLSIDSGRRINGWFIPARSQSTNSHVKVVLFCHGNTGNISHRMATVDLIDRFGLDHFLFDYAGFGRSEGKPTEKAVYEDTRAAYNWLIEEKGYRPDQILVFGRSLGGAIAIWLASEVECAGLVVESSFTSAAAIGRHMFPYLPTNLLSRYQFDSVDRIASVNCPVLVVHSPADDLIPFWMGRALHEAVGENSTFLAIEGSHNERDYCENEEYLQGWREFMQSLERPDPQNR